MVGIVPTAVWIDPTVVRTVPTQVRTVPTGVGTAPIGVQPGSEPTSLPGEPTEPRALLALRLLAGSREGERAWYPVPMITTIDKAGRVVIPAEIREQLGFNAGTELEMVIEGVTVRLIRAVAGPELVRRGERLIARPRAAEGERAEVDVARLVEEERDRWPG